MLQSVLEESLMLPAQSAEHTKYVSHSVVSNSVTPWTVGPHAALSMEFSRQEY